MDNVDFSELPAIQQLQAELSKTVVLSDGFKDYLLQSALTAANEALSGRRPETETLHEAFVHRRFSDVTAVKIRARTLAELCDGIQSDDQLKGIVVFMRKHFKTDDPIRRMLIGSFDDLVAFREWFWSMIEQEPDDFARTVRLGEWSS